MGHRARVPRNPRKIRSELVAVRFGQNLARARRREGLSQEALGVRASLHRTEIGLLEHGRRVARIDTLIQIAGAMSIDPTELLEGIYWTGGEPARGTFSVSPLEGPPSPGDEEDGEKDEEDGASGEGGGSGEGEAAEEGEDSEEGEAADGGGGEGEEVRTDELEGGAEEDGAEEDPG